MYVNRCCNFTRQKCDEERSREDSKTYTDFTIETQSMWNAQTTVIGTNNNRGNWNLLKLIQKIPEQHTGKARNKGTAENSHVGHCTHTAGSTNVKYKTFLMGNNVIGTTNCKSITKCTERGLKYRIAPYIYRELVCYILDKAVHC